jgi:hypothetical protein
MSHKLSVESLNVDTFEAGSYASFPETAGRDCTSFPVCPRTDTTDAAAADMAAQLPGTGMQTLEPGCTAFPELCPMGTHPTGG